MTVTNNTSKLITLLNEKKIKPHETVNVSNPNDVLLKQIEALVKRGLLSASF